MGNMGTHFPTKKEVKRHWLAQDTSVFRRPYTRDPGLSIVHNMGEVQEVLTMETSGHPVELFKSRSPATTYADPVAKAQQLIRWHHTDAPTKAEFASKVVTLEDQQLMLILYGDMSDSQRTKALNLLSKQIFEAHKHQENLMQRERAIEAKETNNLLKARVLQQEMLKKEEERRKAALPPVTVDSVSE